MNEKLFKKIPILFMGTPDFAVIQLSSLVENSYNIIGVVTQPDKPKGRGYTLISPPVKIYAADHGINIYQPLTLKKKSFFMLLDNIKPELIIVAAFGKILPPNVINFPKFGCINVHGSLLPKYRGAAPIQRAIIAGELVTGITVMQMDEGIDTGDILYTSEIPILPDDNFEKIHDRLAETGSHALIKTLGLLADNKINKQKQNESYATYAVKIENQDCILDFSHNARQLHNRIRGLSPAPLAVTCHRGKKIKIIESVIYDDYSDAPAGTVLSTTDNIIRVVCGEGVLGIKTLLPEGKRRMSAADYINGRNIMAGDIMGDLL